MKSQSHFLDLGTHLPDEPQTVARGREAALIKRIALAGIQLRGRGIRRAGGGVLNDHIPIETGEGDRRHVGREGARRSQGQQGGGGRNRGSAEIESFQCAAETQRLAALRIPEAGDFG